MVHRLLEDLRGERKAPDQEAVRTAFLREVLGPMGRIGLSCRARLAEASRGALGFAILDVLARRGCLGLESISQLTGIGRPRVMEHLRDLTRRGLLLEESGRYWLEDRVLAFRFQALAAQRDMEPWLDPEIRSLAWQLENQDVGRWEQRIRSFLRVSQGRLLPARPFGAEGSVRCPSDAHEEAPVGYDRQGKVDGEPSMVAADLLLNGRDRRWLVEMPREGLPYSGDQMRRSLRMLDFFATSYRRSIDHLWVASAGGFSSEARDLARSQGVLTTDSFGLGELERGLLASVA
jgi:hypothetical protein